MNKNNVKIIITMASLALIGLIAIQVYWINNAMTLSKQRFEQNVNDALSNVVSRMEKQITASKIRKKFNFRKQGIRWFSPTDSLARKSEFISDSKSDKNDFTLQKDKINVKIYEEYSSDSNGVIVKKSRHKNYLSDSASSEMSGLTEMEVPTYIHQFNSGEFHRKKIWSMIFLMNW